MADERSTGIRERIKVGSGDIIKISPDLDHPSTPFAPHPHPDWKHLDYINIDLSELFDGRPVSATIGISEFTPPDEHITFLTPSGRNKRRLPIQVDLSVGLLVEEEAKELQAQLFYKGTVYDVPLAGDITLIERGEEHWHKSWARLRDPQTGKDLWAQFNREPNPFEEDVKFAFRKRAPQEN